MGEQPQRLYTPPGAHIYPKAFYSIQEASAILGVSEQTIRDRIKDKTLAAWSLGQRTRKRYRIPASEIVRSLTPYSAVGK